MGAESARIDCAVLDLVMPDLDGLGVLARMREAGSSIPVIVQTAHGGIDNVVSAMRAGAVDFVVKPVSPERLHVSLRNALANRALAGELQRLKRSRAGTLTFKDIVHAARWAVLSREKAAASRSGADRGGSGSGGIDRARHHGWANGGPSLHRGNSARSRNQVESTLLARKGESPAHERHAGNLSRRARPLCSTRSANCRGRRKSSSCARQEGEIDRSARAVGQGRCAVISAPTQLIDDVKAGASARTVLPPAFFRIAVRICARGRRILRSVAVPRALSARKEGQSAQHRPTHSLLNACACGQLRHWRSGVRSWCGGTRTCATNPTIGAICTR